MKRRFAVCAAALLAAACSSAQTLPPAPLLAQNYADYLIGRTANLRDDHAAAADRYFAAIERSPDNAALIEGALNSTLALGDAERARRAARLATERDAPASAYLVRAADAVREQDWRGAGRELTRAEGDAAEELMARVMQIWVSVGGGRLDGALLQLEPLASVRPYGGLFAYQQAMALDLAGRGDEALAAYEMGAHSELVLPAGVVHHAQLLLGRQRRDDAAAVLRTAFAASSDPLIGAALARVEAGGAATSEPLTPAQGAAVGVYGLGAIFLQERDTESALIALTLAQILAPDFDQPRLLFAETQTDLRRYDSARDALARIPSSSPYSANARILDAWVLFDSGREQEAVSLAQAAARSGDLYARRALADMYARLDRYGEAEPIYSDLIAADAQNWRLYYWRGAARERTGRWPEAEMDLRRALELAPQQPEILNYLGYSWIDRGENVREGMSMVERALALRPDSGAIMDSLGWGHYRLGNYDQAVQHLERAVEYEPADAAINEHLGDVYWRLGRRIEARFQWRRALTLSPADAAALEAKIAHGLPAVRAARR